MNHRTFVEHVLEEFQQTYPLPAIGRAHRVFVGRDEAAVIELRPEAGERRRFMVDVLNRMGLPTRYHYTIRDDGTLEGRREDYGA
jgi:hypothetical protein